MVGVTTSTTGCRVGTAGPDGGRLQPLRRTGTRELHGGVVVMQEAGSTAEFPNVAGLHALSGYEIHSLPPSLDLRWI